MVVERVAGAEGRNSVDAAGDVFSGRYVARAPSFGRGEVSKDSSGGDALM